MMNKYSNNEVKEEFGTLSFNHVLLYKKDTKSTKSFFTIAKYKLK